MNKCNIIYIFHVICIHCLYYINNRTERKHVLKFIDEINQQPGALYDLLQHYNDEYPPAGSLSAIIKERRCNEFIFTGMGSSYFVCYIACVILRKNGIRAYAFETKEFMSSRVYEQMGGN